MNRSVLAEGTPARDLTGAASRWFRRSRLGPLPVVTSRDRVDAAGYRGRMARLRSLLRLIAPHGVIEERDRRRDRRLRAAEASRLAEARSQRIATLREHADAGSAPPFAYEAAVDLLVASGLDEAQVRAGSMPESSLTWAMEAVAGSSDDQRPLLALHVGNFVGVSLAAMTAALVARHPDALVVSVDPGIPHRGVEDPQSHVLRLLSHFGLQDNSIVISGFSESKSPRDDGLDFTGAGGVHAPDLPAWEASLRRFEEDAACEQVLPNLARLLPGRFDVVLLDGNHDGDYLRKELDVSATLLAPGGHVVLDDVMLGDVWRGIGQAFADAAAGAALERVGDDGRAGLLRRTDAK